jgi:uncharacterized protein with HEPN domain
LLRQLPKIHSSKDEVLPAAVLHHLTVIGEAINRFSVELRERHPEVRWRQILAVRHRIVHAYFDLDWQILWDAATAKFSTSSQRSFQRLKPIETW